MSKIYLLLIVLVSFSLIFAGCVSEAPQDNCDDGADECVVKMPNTNSDLPQNNNDVMQPPAFPE